MQIAGLKSFLDETVLGDAVDHINKLFKKQEAHIRAGNFTSNHSSNEVLVESMILAGSRNVPHQHIPSMFVVLAAALLVGGSFVSLAIYAKRPQADDEVYLLQP